MVGTAIATEAYATAVQVGSAGAEILADKAKLCAENTIELAKTAVPDRVDAIRESINEYDRKANLTFNL